MVVFDERGAKEYPGKTSQGRVLNQQAQPFLSHRIKPWSPCLKGYDHAHAHDNGLTMKLVGVRPTCFQLFELASHDFDEFFS